MQPDSALLREYTDHRSDEAFAGLVARHINLVYSVAMRQTGQTAQAEEITQAVFIILARKAGQLRNEKALGSWLFQTTRLTANNYIRSEIRRRRREQEAYMQSVLDESGRDELWQRIGPMLDAAVASLNEKDRRAIVLRFYEGRNLAEVGAALQGNEESAKKRVARALEKLQRFFSRRGVDSTSKAIGEVISINSIQAAPAALGKTVTAVAVAKGSAATATIATLVKGTMNTMTWLKVKFAAGFGLAVLIAGGIVTVAVSQTYRDSGGPTAQAIIKNAQDAYAALSSYSDSGEIKRDVGSQSLNTTFDIRLQRPNMYRIDWAQASDYFTNNGVVWSVGGDNYLLITPWRKPESYRDMKTALAAATGVSGQASATIPAVFFGQNWGNVLMKPDKATLEPDATIDGVDCYVVSSSTGPSNSQGMAVHRTTTTLWIGKQDYLIRQVQTVMEGASMKIPEISDAEITKMLEQQGKPVTPEAIAATRKQIQAGMKQAQAMMKSGKFVFMQTHHDIVVNYKYAARDFAE